MVHDSIPGIAVSGIATETPSQDIPISPEDASKNICTHVNSMVVIRNLRTITHPAQSCDGVEEPGCSGFQRLKKTNIVTQAAM